MNVHGRIFPVQQQGSTQMVNVTGLGTGCGPGAGLAPPEIAFKRASEHSIAPAGLTDNRLRLFLLKESRYSGSFHARMMFRLDIFFTSFLFWNERLLHPTKQRFS